jgi:MarR family transcriptional regulator, organic hydroperoxide resistance regulator
MSTKKDKARSQDKIAELFPLIYSARDALVKLAEKDSRKYRITLTQTRILYILVHEKRGLTQNELSNILQRSFNSVSTLVSRMVKKGLLQKLKNDLDNQYYVYLTDEGRKLDAQISTKGVVEVLQTLSVEEWNQLRYILIKIIKETRKALLTKWDENTSFLI